MTSKSFQNGSKLNGIVSVLQFGAVGDNNSNNDEAFADATTYAVDNGLGIVIPSGTYILSSKWVIQNSGMRIWADGLVRLKFTNEGNCIEIDGGAATTEIFDVHFGTASNPIFVEGNVNTTNAVFWRAAHRGSCAVKVWNAVTGLKTSYAKRNDFYISCSSSEHETTSVLVPTVGISLEARGAGENTADNNFWNPVIEGVATSTGYGINLINTNRNKFWGGISKSNVVGVQIESTAIGDSFNGLRCETNTGAHFNISGNLITLTDCFASDAPTAPTTYVKFYTGATDCRVIGGTVPAVTIDSGAVRTQLIGIANASGNIVTDNGTNTSIIQGNTYQKQPFGIYLGSGSEPIKSYNEGIVEDAVITTESGTITMDPSFSTLHWVKVGRIVTVTGILKISSVVDLPAGVCTVGDLPYLSKNLAGCGVAVNVRAASLASGAQSALQGRIEPNSNKILLETYNDGAAVNLSPYLQADSTLYISTSYISAE